MPLHKPPSWAEGLSHERREITADATKLGEQSSLQESHSEHDFSLFRLKVRHCDGRPFPLKPFGTHHPRPAPTANQVEVDGPEAVAVHWWFPPANPGSRNAWIGLYFANDVEWHEDSGDTVMGSGNGKLCWR